MIYLGTQEVQRIFLGTQEVKSKFLPDIDRFNLENVQARAYMSDVDYSSDTGYLYSYIENYLLSRDYTIWSKPDPVVLRWTPSTAGVHQKIYISSNADYTDSWTYEVSNATERKYIYNLIPSRTYYYKIVSVSANEEETIIKEGSVETLGKLRMLNIDGEGVGNFRDLGGWALPNSKHIKYGLLIRGAEVYRNSSFVIEISQEGIDELKYRLGCTTEIDFGDFSNYSPLAEAGFDVYANSSLYGFYAYDNTDRGLRSENGRTMIANCFRVILNTISNGKPIYFHCNSGADRTGTLAFIIESLLGVSDSDKSKDYELTSFWAYNFYGYKYTIRKRNQTPSNGEDTYGYNTMISFINNTFSGNTLNEKVYNMCILPVADGGLGISVSDITTLRNILIEDD